MKVLYAAAESAPFVQSGGLGEVIGSLPKYLKKQQVDVRVILPKYEDINDVFKDKMKYITDFLVPIGWRKQYCGISKLIHENITFYFVDNEYYFKRKGLYGYPDDGERFAFFNKAVLEALPYLDFTPDIIHCHDWHTGMLSVLLDSNYKNNPFYQNIKTVYSIHNLKYQGVFPRSVLTELFNLSENYFVTDKLEFYGDINFMKGGIVFSNLVTTVSKSYAEEIKYPYFGENLDGLLRQKEYKLRGILNGIDFEKFDPQKDKNLFVNYKNSLSKKNKNKIKLQEQLGLPVNENTPIISIVSRLANQKGLDLVERILDEMLNLDIQMVVLGTGEKKYEDMFKYFAYKYPTKLSLNLYFEGSIAQKIYAGSDLFLMPSLFEPCGLGQLIALRYGTIPIVRETGGLKDTIVPFNEYTDKGNGFSFANYNAHELLFTIKRALSFYQDKKLWSKLVERATKEDNSWEKSSLEYKNLYQELIDIK
ncbi:glycogen synthase (ADP-glucose) [Desulfonispora thiosulfatigenes DSM 11270]|uniref:Glycogen synthase n=1 Tax=Desulfonispora thiosulfatigenes DSM 11270 TaxID=656914 RepID=A0A1W1VLQ9_DESTI|nr:glycogen synthase GlgA [Desulfonispora thiosulfatigenes]SMB94319.1 glycogen synthase (ADP-glucose) [Desulfonispora thiosulfatigenes DSM 11270]